PHVRIEITAERARRRGICRNHAGKRPRARLRNEQRAARAAGTYGTVRGRAFCLQQNWTDSGDGGRARAQRRSALHLIRAPAGDDSRLPDTRVATEQQRNDRGTDVLGEEHHADVERVRVSLAESREPVQRFSVNLTTAADEDARAVT